MRYNYDPCGLRGWNEHDHLIRRCQLLRVHLLRERLRDASMSDRCTITSVSVQGFRKRESNHVSFGQGELDWSGFYIVARWPFLGAKFYVLRLEFKALTSNGYPFRCSWWRWRGRTECRRKYWEDTPTLRPFTYVKPVGRRLSLGGAGFAMALPTAILMLQSVILRRYLSSGLSTENLPDFPSKTNSLKDTNYI